MDYIKELGKAAALLERIEQDYRIAMDGLHYEQDVIQDISHKLELCKTTSTERQKLATIYANAARKRRKYKEKAELLKPLMEYKNCEAMTKELKTLVQEMESIAMRQQARQYTPRTKKIHFDGIEAYDYSRADYGD